MPTRTLEEIVKALAREIGTGSAIIYANELYVLGAEEMRERLERAEYALEKLGHCPLHGLDRVAECTGCVRAILAHLRASSLAICGECDGKGGTSGNGFVGLCASCGGTGRASSPEGPLTCPACGESFSAANFARTAEDQRERGRQIGLREAEVACVMEALDRRSLLGAAVLERAAERIHTLCTHPPASSPEGEREAGRNEGLEAAAAWHERQATRYRAKGDIAAWHHSDAASIRALRAPSPAEGAPAPRVNLTSLDVPAPAEPAPEPRDTHPRVEGVDEHNKHDHNIDGNPDGDECTCGARRCPTCLGSGNIGDNDYKRCSPCTGTGWLPRAPAEDAAPKSISSILPITITTGLVGSAGVIGPSRGPAEDAARCVQRLAEVASLRAERDAARGEIERLREGLEQVTSCEEHMPCGLCREVVRALRSGKDAP